MPIQSQKAWIFDLDGTLVDSHHVYFKSLEWLFQQYGLPLSEEDKKEALRISGKNRRDFFVRRVGETSADHAMKQMQSRIATDLDNTRPFDGIVELLQTLVAKRLRIAVWSARELDSALEVLHHTKLHGYFSFFVGSTCLENCKPHPEGLERIASRFESDAKDMLLVGDHDNDMMAARAFGAQGIRAKWHRNDPNWKCSISNQQFATVGELLYWVKKDH